jgi:hypothetical protein
MNCTTASLNLWQLIGLTFVFMCALGALTLLVLVLWQFALAVYDGTLFERKGAHGWDVGRLANPYSWRRS